MYPQNAIDLSGRVQGWFRLVPILSILYSVSGATSLAEDDPPSETSDLHTNSLHELATKYALKLEVLASRGFGTARFGSHYAHDLILVAGRVAKPLGDTFLKDSFLEGKLDATSSLITGIQDSPSTAYFFGLNVGLRYTFSTGTKWLPYLLGHVGIAATDIGEPDLSGVFQFNEQGGVGLRYQLSTNRSVLTECTFMHASNGGISEPNDGLNAIVLTVGYSWQF